MFVTSVWFWVLVTLIGVFFLFFLAFNVGYFNKFRTCTKLPCLTHEEIVTMLWFSVVLMLVAVIFVVVGIVASVILSKSKAEKAK